MNLSILHVIQNQQCLVFEPLNKVNSRAHSRINSILNEINIFLRIVWHFSGWLLFPCVVYSASVYSLLSLSLSLQYIVSPWMTLEQRNYCEKQIENARIFLSAIRLHLHTIYIFRMCCGNNNSNKLNRKNEEFTI